MPAGASGIAPPEGLSSDDGLAAWDGNTGGRDNGGPEALRASEIPPWAASDNRVDSNQNLTVFIAPLFTSTAPCFAVRDTSAAGPGCQPSINAAIVTSVIAPFRSEPYRAGSIFSVNAVGLTATFLFFERTTS